MALYETAQTLLSSAARTGSGTGSAVDLGVDTTVELLLEVTALDGTLTVLVETSRDGANGWAEVIPHDGDGNNAKFSVVSATGAQWITFPGCSRYVRVSWSTTGAGNHTAAVTGYSYLVYCTPTDIEELALNAAWLDRCSSRKQDKAARTGTGQCNSALNGYTLPPTAWGEDLRRAAACLAACDLLISEGIKPEEQDQLLFARCEEVREWLDKVQRGERVPDGFGSTTDGTTDDLCFFEDRRAVSVDPDINDTSLF